MAKSPATQKAMAFGKKRANLAIAARRRVTARARAASSSSGGMLLAEGDSWFDFPLNDVLSTLERAHNFRIESIAHKGDNVEGMAYDDAQLISLTRKLDNLQRDGHVPRAILLSGGGNDIAGEEFRVLLNHANSGLPTVNARIVEGLIDERLRVAMLTLISTLSRLSEVYFKRAVPIVVHGYGYVVPDGRGFFGGAWILPGPWLEPGFRGKGHGSLPKNTRVMVELIDRYNTMLARLPRQAGFAHVHYLDLRKALSNELIGREYRKWWADELHPTKKGFALVASAFAGLVRKLPQA
jgi:lysophospholipase L1-like esterase